jgi:hypothetical protein
VEKMKQYDMATGSDGESSSKYAVYLLSSFTELPIVGTSDFASKRADTAAAAVLCR